MVAVINTESEASRLRRKQVMWLWNVADAEMEFITTQTSAVDRQSTRSCLLWTRNNNWQPHRRFSNLLPISVNLCHSN